jgi:hypothetical protein
MTRTRFEVVINYQRISWVMAPVVIYELFKINILHKHPQMSYAYKMPVKRRLSPDLKTVL